jgi:hypothetical protein
MRLHELEEPDYDIQARYDHFNRMLFNSVLPKVKCIWNRRLKAGGRVWAELIPDPYRRGHQIADMKTCTLSLSPRYSRDARGFDQMLLHEMIHVYFFDKGDTNHGHGVAFERMRERLSTMVGFEIPRRDDTEGLALANDKIKPVLVLIADEKGVPTLCTVLASSMLAKADEIETHYTKIMPRTPYTRIRLLIMSTTAWTKVSGQSPNFRSLGKYLPLRVVDPQATADLANPEKVIFDLQK